MKVSLSRFGFCGIVIQDSPAWMDTTIIGWFTTMTMIRNILNITKIAALVPTTMSIQPASADAEIALFSTASFESNSLTITGNGDGAKMELKHMYRIVIKDLGVVGEKHNDAPNVCRAAANDAFLDAMY
jgi:hypothetical protein